jgi:hypothetical protein
MHVKRRELLLGGAAVVLVSPAPLQPQVGSGRFTPEAFGARGDGITNDTAAFARLAAAVNAAGGGTVSLRKTTYIVGQQAPSLKENGYYSFAPAPILEFLDCSRAVTLIGNGARLRCAPGLRYGTFDRRSGRATRNKLPFTGSQVATPYSYMIKVQNCSGGVEISDLELDGNLPALSLGGEYGDTGRQIAAVGLALFNNRGREIIRNVHTHHHALDGLLIDGVNAATGVDRRIIDVRSEYNGRQGCSIVGGQGYVFEGCQFNHTGKSTIASSPGAGVDVEAEGGKRVRKLSFVDCEFVNNSGCGLVADTGDSADARFENCRFVGTSNWAAWPRKPRFRFFNCSFVGAICNTFGSPDASEAAQFHDCEFRDDPRLSPTGIVYARRTIADLSSHANVLFSRCRFQLTHSAVLPWSLNVIYADCTMEQKSREQAYPRGLYRGRNVIRGNVDLSGSKNIGELVVNGTIRS